MYWRLYPFLEIWAELLVQFLSKPGQDLPHPCLPATNREGSGEGRPLPYQTKKSFLSPLVSKRRSSFTLKIKKGRKWLTSRLPLILMLSEWVIKSFFFWHLFSLPMLDILMLILKKKWKEFFPLCRLDRKDSHCKNCVLFVPFWCMYNYWG